MFSIIDTNGDGLIDYDELLSYGETQERAKTPAEQAEFLMKHYDTDKSGFLEADEVRKLLDAVPLYGWDEPEALALFMLLMDSNFDAKISKEELQ